MAQNKITLLPLLAGVRSTKNPKKYSTELTYINGYTNNVITLNDSDVIKFFGLKIPINYEDDFTNLIIMTNQKIIWKIPFKLIYFLSNIKKTKKFEIIIFPKKLFVKIFLTKTIESYTDFSFHDFLRMYNSNQCEFILEGYDNIKYDLLINKYYIDTKERNHILNTKCEYVINQYNQITFTNSEIIIKDSAISTGIFIEMNVKIKNLQILWNEYTILYYDEILLMSACNILYNYKWSNKHHQALFETLFFFPKDILRLIESHVNYAIYLYWIPFEQSMKWNSKNIDNTINFDKLNNSKIIINENDKKTINGKIYIMEFDNIIYNKQGIVY